jgi:Ca2+-binding EF-hand superfamily protein
MRIHTSKGHAAQRTPGASACSIQLFNIWDEDGDGTLSEQDLWRDLKMLNIRYNPEHFDAIVKVCSPDVS